MSILVDQMARHLVSYCDFLCLRPRRRWGVKLRRPQKVYGCTNDITLSPVPPRAIVAPKPCMSSCLYAAVVVLHPASELDADFRAQGGGCVTFAHPKADHHDHRGAGPRFSCTRRTAHVGTLDGIITVTVLWFLGNLHVHCSLKMPYN